MGIKQKIFLLFEKKKIQNGRLKKTEFSKITNSQIVFAWSPWKSVTNYMIEGMGLNFDVFPGFQKIPCYA